MRFDQVLIVNGYAGSLTVAAAQARLRIVASMEDARYGLDAQRANFPDLTYVEQHPWPDPGFSLDEVMVIAHPPCAAFASQSSNWASCDEKHNRGVGSGHFQHTRDVIDYAGTHDAPAVMIESVRGALEGARAFYDEYPRRYGYDVYRILQNACTFGVPQWRPRYWTVLVREGLLPRGTLILKHRRNYRSLGEALAEPHLGDENRDTVRHWDKAIRGLLDGGLTWQEISDLAHGEFGFGPIDRILGKRDELEEVEVRAKYGISGFDSHVFNVLNPVGIAPTVMCGYNWLWHGRPVNVPELNVIAGFPASYRFPKLREQKCYLSKGVAPPVARWLLGEVRTNLACEAQPLTSHGEHMYLVQPGEIADLQVTRTQVAQRDMFTSESVNN